MYVRFAERRGFKVSVLSESEAEQGGLKEVVAEIEGEGAYSLFRFESGVHRVQRVPKTETQGRIHTSACTVAVMPEAEEVDIDDQREGPAHRHLLLRRQGRAERQHHLFRGAAHPPAHQHRGAVPGRAQPAQEHGQGHDRAALAACWRRPRARRTPPRPDLRKTQVGSGDRSEKIRTYNFPQGRVTDHRVNVTIHQLDAFMQGLIEPILEPLRAAHEAERLRQLEA